MDIEDIVQIRCSRCKSKFRDKARRVLSGYSRQCPCCECMVFFEDGTPNKDIDEALREAARVRKALRDEEAERKAKAERTAIRLATSAEQSDDDANQASHSFTASRKSRSSLAGRART
jgi:predicted  nucleic acid-binding Zn-ribbon protein